MQLLIYAPPILAAGRLLQQLPDSLHGVRSCQTFTTIAALCAHLRQPLGLPSICILAPLDGRELTQLKGMRHLLRDMRIILILPDSMPQTVSEGHFLRPRYITYPDGNLEDVWAVVYKMIETDVGRSFRATG